MSNHFMPPFFQDEPYELQEHLPPSTSGQDLPLQQFEPSASHADSPTEAGMSGGSIGNATPQTTSYSRPSWDTPSFGVRETNPMHNPTFAPNDGFGMGYTSDRFTMSRSHAAGMVSSLFYFYFVDVPNYSPGRIFTKRYCSQ
jgi:hypothetical protein